MTDLTIEKIQWAIQNNSNSEKQAEVTQIFTAFRSNPQNIQFISQLLSEGPNSTSCFFAAAICAHIVEKFGISMVQLQKEELESLFQTCLEFITAGIENQEIFNQVVKLLSTILAFDNELISNVTQLPEEILFEIFLTTNHVSFPNQNGERLRFRDEIIEFLVNSTPCPKWVELFTLIIKFTGDFTEIPEVLYTKLGETCQTAECFGQYFELLEKILENEIENLEKEEIDIDNHIIEGAIHIIESIMSAEPTEEDMQKCIGMMNTIIDGTGTEYFKELEDQEFAHSILNFGLNLLEYVKEVPSELNTSLEIYSNVLAYLYPPDESDETQVQFENEFFKFVDFLNELACTEENTEEEDSEVVFHTSYLMDAIFTMSSAFNHNETQDKEEYIEAYISHLPELSPGTLYIISSSDLNIRKAVAQEIATQLVEEQDTVDYEQYFFEQCIYLIDPSLYKHAVQRVWSVFEKDPSLENAGILQKICFMCSNVLAEDRGIQDGLEPLVSEETILLTPSFYMIISYPLIHMSKELADQYKELANQMIIQVCGAFQEENSVDSIFKFLSKFIKTTLNEFRALNASDDDCDKEAIVTRFRSLNIPFEQQSMILGNVKALILSIIEQLGDVMLNPEYFESISKFMLKAYYHNFFEPSYVLTWVFSAFEVERKPCLYQMICNTNVYEYKALIEFMEPAEIGRFLELVPDNQEATSEAIIVMGKLYQKNKQLFFSFVDQATLDSLVQAFDHFTREIKILLETMFQAPGPESGEVEMPYDANQLFNSMLDLTLRAYNEDTVISALRFFVRLVRNSLYSIDTLKEHLFQYVTDELTGSYVNTLLDEAIEFANSPYTSDGQIVSFSDYTANVIMKGRAIAASQGQGQ